MLCGFASWLPSASGSPFRALQDVACHIAATNSLYAYNTRHRTRGERHWYSVRSLCASRGCGPVSSNQPSSQGTIECCIRQVQLQAFQPSQFWFSAGERAALFSKAILRSIRQSPCVTATHNSAANLDKNQTRAGESYSFHVSKNENDSSIHSRPDPVHQRSL